MMQNTMTTVVDPVVSPLVGKETFLTSARTSVKNSTTDAQTFLNIFTPADGKPPLTDPAPSRLTLDQSRALAQGQPAVAGAPGIEPGPSVLETDVLAVEHHAPVRTVMGDE